MSPPRDRTCSRAIRGFGGPAEAARMGREWARLRRGHFARDRVLRQYESWSRHWVLVENGMGAEGVSSPR